jgi:hypothetical protein
VARPWRCAARRQHRIFATAARGRVKGARVPAWRCLALARFGADSRHLSGVAVIAHSRPRGKEGGRPVLRGLPPLRVLSRSQRAAARRPTPPGAWRSAGGRSYRPTRRPPLTERERLAQALESDFAAGAERHRLVVWLAPLGQKRLGADTNARGHRTPALMTHAIAGRERDLDQPRGGGLRRGGRGVHDRWGMLLVHFAVSSAHASVLRVPGEEPRVHRSLPLGIDDPTGSPSGRTRGRDPCTSTPGCSHSASLQCVPGSGREPRRRRTSEAPLGAASSRPQAKRERRRGGRLRPTAPAEPCPYPGNRTYRRSCARATRRSTAIEPGSRGSPTSSPGLQTSPPPSAPVLQGRGRPSAAEASP